MKSLLEKFADNNFIVTTDNWFVAPNGLQYKSAWGKIEVHSSEQTLGIKTNERSTNWYVIVGTTGVGKSVIIAGCQIHYACVCMDKPNTDDITECRLSESLGDNLEYTTRTMIYIAQ